MIDMHVHSVLSDGSKTPAELAQAAKEKGLAGVCLTDHDIHFGSYEMAKECQKLGLLTLWGIEVCVQHLGQYVHLLIYDTERLISSTPFNLNLVQSWRVHQKRTERMLSQYQQAGLLDADIKQIRESLNGYYYPYIHFSKIYQYHARIKGISFCQAREEAKALGIVKPKVSAADFPEALNIIRLAKNNQAICILAHPGTLKPIKAETNAQLVGDFFAEFLKELIPAGLDGLEAYHTKHSLVQERIFSDYAQEHGLAISGGSDYHGDLTPKVNLGDKGLSLADFQQLPKKARK